MVLGVQETARSILKPQDKSRGLHLPLLCTQFRMFASSMTEARCISSSVSIRVTATRKAPSFRKAVQQLWRCISGSVEIETETVLPMPCPSIWRVFVSTDRHRLPYEQEWMLSENARLFLCREEGSFFFAVIGRGVGRRVALFFIISVLYRQLELSDLRPVCSAYWYLSPVQKQPSARCRVPTLCAQITSFWGVTDRR